MRRERVLSSILALVSIIHFAIASIASSLSSSQTQSLNNISSNRKKVSENQLLTNEFSGPDNYIWPASYSPFQVLCPSSSLIRVANNEINSREKEYISNRQRLTQFSLRKFLGRAQIPNFDYDSFLLESFKPVNIALSVSGGGYRAMLTAAGVVAAFDERTPNSTDTGHLGGLLQSTSYIAGVSGGSWLVMSMLLHDYKSVVELRDSDDGWSLYEPLLEGVPNFDVKVSRSDVQSSPNGFDEELKISNDIDDDFDDEEEDYLYDYGKNVYKDDKSKEKIKKENQNTILKNILWFGKDEKEAELKINKLKNVKKEKTEHESFKSAKFPKGQKLTKRSDQSDSPKDYKPKDHNLMNTILNMFFNVPKDSDSTNSSGSNNSQPLNLKKIFGFYRDLHIEIRAKRIAGFHISLTDYWGRALSRKIFSRAARSPGTTLSSAAKLKSFRRFQQPYPIFLANEGAPSGEEINSMNSHIFEFTPYEFGSWDKYLNSFVNISYLGTFLYDGKSNIPTEDPSQSMCVSGFDNAGFITGTSSSLFNNVFVYLWQLFVNTNKETNQALKAIFRTFGLSSSFKSLKYPSHHPDYALFTPNPFFGFKGYSDHPTTISKAGHLYLVDGGEDGQNIPFQPLLQRSRNVDVIFAVDTTSDVANFPNGTSLNYTAQRYHANEVRSDSYQYFMSREKNLKSNYSSVSVKPRSIFPYVPSFEEMENRKLNKHPIFLGCNLSSAYPEIEIPSKEMAKTEDIFSKNNEDTYLPPLIIYLANAQYSFPSNRSTFQLSYTQQEVSQMIENGYNIGTYANSTIEADYSQCVACALLKREFDRIEYGISTRHPRDFNVPSTCEKCFERYCWN